MAACGPLPRPFAPEVKPFWQGPLRLADGAGVIVLADACAAGVADEVIAALARRDVPASTGHGNRGSLWLACTPRDEGGQSWSLLDGDGRPLADFSVPAATEEAGAVVAGRVVALLAGERGGAPPRAMPALLVSAVAGVPNGGGATLRRAMEEALQWAGAPLAESPTDETLLVLGSVAVRETAGGAQRVEVLWEVVEPDGSRLGVVSQANTVPRGALEGEWRPLADEIARGGAEGVIDLVTRVAAR